MTLMAFGSPSFALGLLVLLKVVVDLGAHLWQHLARPAVAPKRSPPGPSDPIPKS